MEALPSLPIPEESFLSCQSTAAVPPYRRLRDHPGKRDMADWVLFHKRIGHSLVMYYSGVWGPILIPNMGSPGILTGVDAYSRLCDQRQLIRARYVITGSCNLRCYHCYASDGYDNAGASTEDAKRIIDEIAAAGAFFLQLDGGEVGCRNDLSDLINHATDRGLIIEFFTNGTLFDDEFFARTDLGNVYCVVFSIHSHIASIHDSLTGSRGSFERALRNIKRFAGNVRKLVLKMTITKENVSSLPGLHSLSRDLGVDFGYDIDLLPQSRSRQDSLELGEVEVSWMRETCPDVFANTPTKKICIGGTSSCTIDQDGNLFPCRLVNINLGNVLQKPLTDLWNSDAARDVATKVFGEPAECSSCGELSQFCFYCPGKPFMAGVEREHWVTYNCSLARRKRALHDDN